ncbi:MAG: TIGR03435 family protein, partial [Deltaproteobacteria bacterium]
RFEVASVKVNNSNATSVGWRAEPGRFTATNVTLKMLISTAYGPPEQPLPDYEMSGGPSWLGTARFDVIATAPDATSIQMVPMMRHLLEDRFMLRTHFEMQQHPVYTMVLANSDGTLGPGMRRSTMDCAALAADPSAPYRCGGGQIFPGTLLARGVSMARIVNGLARVMPGVSRPVIDNTGLTGTFDIDLKWRPDNVPQNPDARMPPIDPNAPDLFTALREQWGVRLERGTGPIPVLMIDGVSLPTPD